MSTLLCSDATIWKQASEFASWLGSATSLDIRSRALKSLGIDWRKKIQTNDCRVQLSAKRRREHETNESLLEWRRIPTVPALALRLRQLCPKAFQIPACFQHGSQQHFLITNFILL